MLISEAIELFQNQENSTLIKVSDTSVIQPSTLVLFISDILGIVQKTQKNFTNEQVIETVTKMMQQKTVEQIPNLVVQFEENKSYDHFINDKFVSNSQKQSKQFIFIQTIQPLLQACQMMNTHSVIYVDEDMQYIINQFQTIHFHHILKSKDYLHLLLSPVYKFLTYVSQETIEEIPPFIKYADDKVEQMIALRYDYAIEFNDQSKGLQSVQNSIQI